MGKEIKTMNGGGGSADHTSAFSIKVPYNLFIYLFLSKLIFSEIPNANVMRSMMSS